ncbi:NOL1/NOP2/sun family protein, partial [Chlamydia psittaci 06-1683]
VCKERSLETLSVTSNPEVSLSILPVLSCPKKMKSKSLL